MTSRKIPKPRCCVRGQGTVIGPPTLFRTARTRRWQGWHGCQTRTDPRSHLTVLLAVSLRERSTIWLGIGKSREFGSKAKLALELFVCSRRVVLGQRTICKPQEIVFQIIA